jgi:preprotein translocase subunit SecY
MASAADQLASSINLSKFSKATELKKRLWFTLGALIVFRLLSYVPIPGIDPTQLGLLTNNLQGGVIDFFNSFTGGALNRASVVALGVMPYITASIVVQLATSLSPQLAAIKKEGESGRKRLNQYTRYGTVGLTAVQGYFIAAGCRLRRAAGRIGRDRARPAVPVGAVISLVGGTLFLMWLGEQITSRGVGNGISLIIMAGIVARLPTTLVQLFESGRTGTIDPLRLILDHGRVAGIVLLICFMERAQRRILIQYPKRQTARGVQAERSHLPLKLNTAGVIPPIFASSLLLLPLTITQFAGTAATGESWWGDLVSNLNIYLRHGSPLYMALYAAGIIFFSFFYTAVVFNPEETADNLKRYGGFIPGIRPGKNTENLFRLCADAHHRDRRSVSHDHLPCAGISACRRSGIPFLMGGTSLLIVVNVTMDTVTQIQSHLLAHQYGDLIKKAKLKGRMR